MQVLEVHTALGPTRCRSHFPDWQQVQPLLEHLKTAYNALSKRYMQALGYFLLTEQLHLCHLLEAQRLVTGLKGQPAAQALPSGLQLLEVNWMDTTGFLACFPISVNRLCAGACTCCIFSSALPYSWTTTAVLSLLCSLWNCSCSRKERKERRA